MIKKKGLFSCTHQLAPVTLGLPTFATLAMEWCRWIWRTRRAPRSREFVRGSMVIRNTAIPTPLSHDDSSQSLAAGTATELLQGRAGGRVKLFVATRSTATIFFGIERLGIALATLRGGRFVRLLTLAASLAIPNALIPPAFFSGVGRTIATIGCLLRPFARCGRTLRTAVPREGMRWIESALATL